MSWLLPFSLRNGHFNATTTAQIVPFIMSKTVAQSSRLAAADRERVLIVVPVYPQLFTYRALNLRAPENKASEDGKKIYHPLCRSIPHTTWNVKPFLWNVPVKCGVFRTCHAIARSMYEKSPQLARDLRGEVAQALRSIGNVASVTDEQIDIGVESQLLKAALVASVDDMFGLQRPVRVVYTCDTSILSKFCLSIHEKLHGVSHTPNDLQFFTYSNLGFRFEKK